MQLERGSSAEEIRSSAKQLPLLVIWSMVRGPGVEETKAFGDRQDEALAGTPVSGPAERAHS
jgi:hypothetical protein